MKIKVSYSVEPNYMTAITGKRGTITAEKLYSDRLEKLVYSFYIDSHLFRNPPKGTRRGLYTAIRKQALKLGWITEENLK